jgi:integrase/recombinase XerD
MGSGIVETVPAIGYPVPRQAEADNDAQLIELWLNGRSEHTQRAYRREVVEFLDYACIDLRTVGLRHLQAWADSPALTAKAPSSRGRAIAAVKSLVAFAHRLGYLPFDVAAPLRSPKLKDSLASRILEESAVHRILALETNPRNLTLLRLLYAAGLRVSEVCGLTWADLKPRDGGQGQATIFGKGGKTREVIIPASVYGPLAALKAKDAGKDSPVFVSRQGGPLTTVQVLRIVRAAAARAGVEGNVSPHWFRHAHASHSLDRGAPISLVQATLGHSSMATTGRYTHARPTESSGRYLAV